MELHEIITKYIFSITLMNISNRKTNQEKETRDKEETHKDTIKHDVLLNKLQKKRQKRY